MEDQCVEEMKKQMAAVETQATNASTPKVNPEEKVDDKPDLKITKTIKKQRPQTAKKKVVTTTSTR